MQLKALNILNNKACVIEVQALHKNTLKELNIDKSEMFKKYFKFRRKRDARTENHNSQLKTY